MTEEEIKQRNESKEFLKDLQYYLFQNKRSPKIDKLSVLLDNDEKRIVELEKENAELKARIDNLFNSDCWASGQLAKAKDFLKQWLQTSKASGCDNINIVAETEQFLKEVEK